MTTGDPPYRFEIGDGYGLIVLLPPLNDCPWSDIEKVGSDVLERLKTEKYRGIVVDLSPLQYMGSAMVALIVRLWKAAKERNKSMVVVNRDPMVLEVLQLAGLHKVWTIVETREEGFRELGVSGRAAGAASGGGKGVALLAVGMLAVVAAVAGVGLLLSKTTAVPAQPAFWTAAAGALVGLAAGTVITLRDQETGRRLMGVVMVVAGLAVLLAALLNMPSSADPSEAPAVGVAEKPAG
ncbi:MAG: STAS domain-containing protein [Planctomycetaceae bacterium]